MPDSLPPAALNAPAVDLAARVWRVAVASKHGAQIDLHFGVAETFRLFDLTAAGPMDLGTRSVADHAQGEEDKRETILRMLSDCHIMLVAKIGVAPQEMLAKAGIDATDLYNGQRIDDALPALYAAKIAALAPKAVDTSKFKLLHAMLRVSDMEKSLDFYTRLLGLKVLDQRDHKKNMFSQAYLGYDDGGMQLELVFNWVKDEPYVMGDSFGHVAIQVTSITALCDLLAAEGYTLPRPPRSQRHGESIVAFVEDPDGYRIELVQPPAETAS